MVKDIKERLELFSTALMQVAFVSMNVTFISKNMVGAMFATGFMISLIWTYNVKKVAFGSTPDRFIYALGAGVGTVIGYLLSNFLSKYL